MGRAHRHRKADCRRHRARLRRGRRDGSIAGQLARNAGARVVGIAGGAEKCRWLVESAGFDAAVDYKADDFKQRLAAALPRGADVVFDNVGGAVLDRMLGNLALGARVVVCGGISRYETGGRPAGPANYFNLSLRACADGRLHRP